MSGINELGKRLVWEKPLRPQRIGLVLGGGAARGIAHIGVLQALEAYQLRPHYIVGASAGALVGGLYAAGLSPADLTTLAYQLKWRDISSLPVTAHWSTWMAPTMPLGILDLDRLMDWIRKILKRDVTFDQLPIPFAAIATDLSTGESIMLNDGPIAPAIRASCSVPGIFTPVRRQGRLLVDGGASNNLPISAVQQMGADYVIAVDLLPLVTDPVAEPKNILEVSITSLYTLIRAAQVDASLAHCVIQPQVGHISLADLTAIEELIVTGYQATLYRIPEILAALGLDAPLEAAAPPASPID
ncbi:MAG: patatin-like phospholipase family protein [Caldilineaceae bacterium]|nr:patatin-like phospholipase family protein [Caldilineaceae bacterium]